MLLLGQILAQQFLRQVLQPVPVGIGAHQLGRDLGAIDRLGHDAEAVLQHGDVETPEMEQLDPVRIGQQFHEVRRLGLVLRDLDEAHFVSAVAQRRGALLTDDQVALNNGLQGFGNVGPAVSELGGTRGALRRVTQRLEDNPSGVLLGGDKIQEFTP